MGNLLAILTGPGALEALRWQWTAKRPVGVIDPTGVPALTPVGGRLAATAASLDLTGQALGWAVLNATVPSPPGWPGSAEAPDLAGLILWGPAGELLGFSGLDPPLRRTARHVTVRFQAMTGG